MRLNQRYLKNYLPSFPITYIYAKDKPLQFQKKEWFDWLEKHEGRYIAVSGGHWVMNKHSDLLIELIRERIKLIKQ